MDINLKFLPGHQKVFLQNAVEKSGLSVNKLATLTNISARNYRNWQREKLNIPLRAVNILCKEFKLILPESKSILTQRWKLARSQAGQVGGFARLRKYGPPGTPEGRSKGGRNGLKSMRRLGIIPSAKKFLSPKQDTHLAEFVGIMLGDGGITFAQINITLNNEADRYYISFVSNLAYSLFGEPPKMHKRKDSKAITLYYNSVTLPRYLSSIGLKVGNKVKQQVGVPDWIKASEEYAKSCLRGLMDTDGCAFLHRYAVGRKAYVYRKLNFSNRSLPLLYFVADQLKHLGFKPKVEDKLENKRLWLYNTKEVDRYFELVGTHNQRLLNPKGRVPEGSKGKVC